ncbi:MAG: ABC transporter ATP-binding protein [Oscillospiraceae bacterium]|jgi:ABC-2 type transport system ATP-binding protein|nr:ABC transporter ATP-binding protein [Oscillospiraceae bacterium]
MDVTQPVIQVENLTRDYTTRKGWVRAKREVIHAVRGITFSVNRGEIFGLLGQNGAGKTTTIKMLITMLAPTSGLCKVLGYDCFGEEKMIRNRINFIFGGERGVYPRLTARDNLRYFANLYKVPLDTREKHIADLLELVGLSDKGDLRVETFSKGMIQRVQIARGLINDPEILFMDEPTVGLDPLGAEMLRGIIKSVQAMGKTVLLTTHNMYEADELCGRIAIMKEGAIIAMDTPAAIKERMASDPVIMAHVAKVKAAQEQKISEVTLEEAYIQLVKGAAK